MLILDYINMKDWPAVVLLCLIQYVSDWGEGLQDRSGKMTYVCKGSLLLFICEGIYRDRFWEVIFRWSGRSVFRPALTGLYISIPLFLYLSLHRSIFYFPLVSNSIFPSKTHSSAYAHWLSRMYRTLSNYTPEHTHTDTVPPSPSQFYLLFACSHSFPAACMHVSLCLPTASCPCFHLCFHLPLFLSIYNVMLLVFIGICM